MKKTFLITSIVLAVSSLMALGFINMSGNRSTTADVACSEPDTTEQALLGPFQPKENHHFEFRVGDRFYTKISREKLRNAKSITDLIPSEEIASMSEFRDVRIAFLPNDFDSEVSGKDGLLNAEQLKLLQAADYSSNFYVKSNCKELILESGRLNDHELFYYISVVPEKQATYSPGYEKLLSYLNENSKQARSEIDWTRLGSGRIQFTVTKNGTIANTKLTMHTGHPNLDNTMIRLISKMPGKWSVAENAQGEAVDQELFFDFGQPGC